MSANARHSKATPRWGTPAEWVAMARDALGGRIEYDPMSEPAFNTVVGAERITTAEQDALMPACDWRCRTMLINPAGGLVVEAWRKLSLSHWMGTVGRAVWFGFSVEQLAILAEEVRHPLDYSVLICRQRLDFLTIHPWRSVDVVESPPGTWRRVLECGHDIKPNSKEKRGRVRCTECVGTPEPNGAPSHANYVVGLGIAVSDFERAFAGRGRFCHGRFAVTARRAA